MLKEVVIKSKPNPIRVIQDTVEYNTAAYQVFEGDNVADLIKQFSGIEVDENYNVKSMGENVVKLRVNGKDFFTNNVQEFIATLPVEMIGYFKDEKHTQDYPIGILSWFYGNKGNYITLVNKFNKGKFARKFSKSFKKSKAIKTKKFTGPKSLPGIDFSDHLNYWNLDYSALMITDTSFYRNKNYHQKTDTMETLDLGRMAKAIDGIYVALLALAS